MACYSVQLKDRIFVKEYDFLSFARNMGKMLIKLEPKTLLVNTVRNFLIMLNNLLQMHSKLLQNEHFKKQQKQLVI